MAPSARDITPEVDRFDFDARVKAQAPLGLQRGPTTTLQVNVGKRCNQACTHCHVEAGPKRTEQMDNAVIDRVIALIHEGATIDCVDITGGAPELHPRFRDLVRAAREHGKRVIDRCNLTILSEPGQEDLAEFLAQHAVEITASLPCYGAENVDKQRGRGVFDRSIEALKILNGLGYGMPNSPLRLNLVYNPSGAFLPGDQHALQVAYQRELLKHFDVYFHELFTLTNMPINRFANQLARDGRLNEYMELLVANFNHTTLDHVMCKQLISVAWDGRVYDCDFNQMLELPLGGETKHTTVFDLKGDLLGKPIATGGHCFACTAGAGSSCGGALEQTEKTT